MVFTHIKQSEHQCVETRENLRLIELAKNRASNGRIGDRALQQLIEQQFPNINSAIRKRVVQLPHLDQEELRFSAIEGIIERLNTYDSSKGCTFSSWVYFGILNGIDRVVRTELKHYKAQLEAQYSSPRHSEQPDQDPGFIELIYEEMASLPETVQEIIRLALDGWKYTEIGKLLGKTADAIRMAYNRGIQKLQSILNPIPSKPSQPRFIFNRRWLSSKLSKVVRKITPLRIHPERPHCPKETLPMNQTTEKRPKFGRVPLAYFQTEEGQERYQSIPKLRLTLKGKLFFTVLLGIFLAVIAHQNPLQAQCAGWLCGGKNAILANEMWGANTPSATVIVNGIFLALQFVAALLIAVPLLIAAALGIRREDYAPYFIGSAIIFIALIAINFMVGWLFGSNTGAT